MLRTDEEGRYRIETIHPGPRAEGRAGSHVHFDLTVPWGERYFDSVSFEGDPRLGNMPTGESWEEIRPVVLGEEGVQHVRKDFWARH